MKAFKAWNVHAIIVNNKRNENDVLAATILKYSGEVCIVLPTKSTGLLL